MTLHCWWWYLSFWWVIVGSNGFLNVSKEPPHCTPYASYFSVNKLYDDFQLHLHILSYIYLCLTLKCIKGDSPPVPPGLHTFLGHILPGLSGSADTIRHRWLMPEGLLCTQVQWYCNDTTVSKEFKKYHEDPRGKSQMMNHDHLISYCGLCMTLHCWWWYLSFWWVIVGSNGLLNVSKGPLPLYPLCFILFCEQFVWWFSPTFTYIIIYLSLFDSQMYQRGLPPCTPWASYISGTHSARNSWERRHRWLMPEGLLCTQVQWYSNGMQWSW